MPPTFLEIGAGLSFAMLGIASGVHALLPVPVQALLVVWLAMLGVALSAGGARVAPHLAASLAP
eukprot:15280301-Alexandrium_andersonii.AAC.1